jgi:phosphoglycolate phosphatase-like HAD superfamily hydrolase
MLGDTASDGRGAAEAGVDFAAVTWGFGFQSEADLAGTDYVACFDRVEDLNSFLQNNL